jgi:hypothetical protein
MTELEPDGGKAPADPENWTDPGLVNRSQDAEVSGERVAGRKMGPTLASTIRRDRTALGAARHRRELCSSTGHRIAARQRGKLAFPPSIQTISHHRVSSFGCW